MTDERRVLTKEEAIAMLPDKKRIHTFRPGGPIGAIWLGADRDRADILAAIEKYEFELARGAMPNMNHGMVFRDEIGRCFVETRETAK